MSDPERFLRPADVSGPARANPFAGNPFVTRDDVADAVRDLYEPLVPYMSADGARVRLGSNAAVFEDRVAELEGFARPLYGIVPLTVGGGEFAHWERVAAGLDAGTDPGSAEYWGAVDGDRDQRMVEQAAIGLALAFCPDRVWEPLSAGARDRLVAWLHGIFDHDPAGNNWQFFRVLVSIGLERVGAPFDSAKVDESLRMLDGWRVGEHWYVDGELDNVDWYVPFAFHTYGLMYAAANDLGLGDDRWAAQYRERAAGFAPDVQHWFGPDGAAVPFGRSLTYRFATSSFWGALAWADVDTDLGWGAVRSLAMRHLRWWAGKPISDRDGVLSIGYTYDNRRLQETYNSAGSPYWAMKAFAGLAAPADHPFWTEAEVDLEPLDAPVSIPDAGQVVIRDADQAVVFNARPATAIDFPEQAAAKYRKFAYSSVFGFSGDITDISGATHTDSMLALTDADGNRRVRVGVDAAGITDTMAWSTWRPWPDVRIDSVCWMIDGARHGRIHRVRTERSLVTVESGFAIGLDRPDDLATGARATSEERVVLATSAGWSAILDGTVVPDTHIDAEDRSTWISRRPIARNLAVNASLVHPRTAVPALQSPAFGPGTDAGGDVVMACLVHASPSRPLAIGDTVDVTVPAAAIELLARTSAAS